ncbi:MAG: aminotransferase class I/II-fold pyridoxal phosphate-dependent enzyme [Acidimicrobiia bacterium]
MWAFSKDFGASGLRCGVLITENEEVFQAVESQAYWAVCSGDTQHMLGELIADDSWADQYINEMQAILGDAFARVTAELSTAGIRFIPGEAGFFFLCDMREFMDEPTWEAEEALWWRILEEANVNITPGSAGHNGEPGFMRLCFASDPTDTVVAGVRRRAGVLKPER